MKTYSIKVVSAKGHTILDCNSVQEARETIVNRVNTNKQWAMIDGRIFEPINITDEVIENAQEILLTNQLVGG